MICATQLRQSGPEGQDWLLGSVLLLLFVAAWAVEVKVTRPLGHIRRQAADLAQRNLNASVAFVGYGELRDVSASLEQVHRLVRDIDQQLSQQRARTDKLNEALREAEERHVMAIRCANDGIWEWDLKSGRMYVSPLWKGMLGYTEAEIDGDREEWRALIHPEDTDAVETALAGHLAGETVRYEQQYRVRHKEGSYRWILSRGAALRHASGKAYRVIGLDTDITRVKRIEKILKEIVEGTTGAFGEAFFRSLVCHFAGALEVNCAFITECADHPPTRVRTLVAFWTSDGFMENVEYELSGTPCETVIKEARTVFLPKGVGTQFKAEAGFEGYLGVPIVGSDGSVIGHLAFLDKAAMTEEMLVDAVYRIFTARAAAELERKAALAALRDAGTHGRDLEWASAHQG
jgi:PAS domain S-box-containing protein